MRLGPDRLRDLIDRNLSADSALTCHSTLYKDVDEALCRGFVDAYGNDSTPLRMAKIFDVITYVDAP